MNDLLNIQPSQDGNPFLYEEDEVVSLHFDFSSIQSRMDKRDPYALILDYTRTMMGFLLFQPQPERIAMIGLGGGSIAKYCHKHLPRSHFTALEIDPKVIALRDRFAIPPDGPQFRVVCMDGADFVRSRPAPLDVLLIDGFDREGLPRQLCTPGFYAHCYSRLREGGVMVVNLWSTDGRSPIYAARIRESFGGKVVVVDTADRTNKVAFAYKGPDFPLAAATLDERVLALDATHRLALQATAQKIQRRSPKIAAAAAHRAPQDESLKVGVGETAR